MLLLTGTGESGVWKKSLSGKTFPFHPLTSLTLESRIRRQVVVMRQKKEKERGTKKRSKKCIKRTWKQEKPALTLWSILSHTHSPLHVHGNV
jgi:hypothetical protein